MKRGKSVAPKREPFSRIEQTESGTQINRVAPIQRPEGLTIEEKVAHDLAVWSSEEGQAYARLRKILNDACVDPVVVKSEQASRFIQFVCEVFYTAQPGDAMERFMEPVETLFASMRSRDGGGGRPSTEDTWRRWASRYAELKLNKPRLTARECYEDIAAEWEDDGHPPVKWRAIRDGISMLKRREKNPV